MIKHQLDIDWVISFLFVDRIGFNIEYLTNLILTFLRNTFNKKSLADTHTQVALVCKHFLSLTLPLLRVRLSVCILGKRKGR